MTPRQLDPQAFNVEGSSIGIILYTEQFYVHKSLGDSTVVPDSKKGGCSISWGKYPDLGRAFLGLTVPTKTQLSNFFGNPWGRLF